MSKEYKRAPGTFRDYLHHKADIRNPSDKLMKHFSVRNVIECDIVWTHSSEAWPQRALKLLALLFLCSQTILRIFTAYAYSDYRMVNGIATLKIREIGIMQMATQRIKCLVLGGLVYTIHDIIVYLSTFVTTSV